MFKWLKKYFIPHEHNDHKPHFLRWEATIVVLSIVLLIEMLFLLQIAVVSKSKFFADILSGVIINETNNNRVTLNVGALQENQLLDKAAQMKADDMASRGYFSHNTPEGYTPWYWFDKVGYLYQFAGENLAVNFFDSKDAIDAWMKSTGHRENILNSNFTETGIGVAKGQYQGKETFFVVQLFGTPRYAGIVPKITTNVPDQFKQIALTPNIQNQTAPAPKDKSVEPALSREITTTTVFQVGQTISKSLAENIKGGEKLSGAVSWAENLAQKIIASPRQMTNYLYLVLITIVILALILKIGIKRKIQYPKLIMNGVIMILITASAILFNHYVVLAQGQIF